MTGRSRVPRLKAGPEGKSRRPRHNFKGLRTISVIPFFIHAEIFAGNEQKNFRFLQISEFLDYSL
jgi:hypothetical protein